MNKEEVLKIVKENKWSIQGFNAFPLYLWSAAVSTNEEMKKTFGLAYTHFFFLFSKGRGMMYYDEADWKKIADYYYQNYDFFKLKKLMANNINGFTKQYESTKEKTKLLVKYNETELLSLAREAIRSYQLAVGGAHAIEGITFGSEKKLREYLKGQEIMESDFGLLCSPVTNSFILEARSQLWKIKQAVGDQQIKEVGIFLADYSWIENSYLGRKSFTTKEILARANELIIEPDLDKTEIIYKKKELMQKLSFHEYGKFIISTIEICFAWQDDRKKQIFQSIELWDIILMEIVNRKNLDINVLKFSLPDEVNSGEFVKQEFSEVLEKRQKQSAIYINFNETCIFTESDYEYLSKNLDVDFLEGEVEIRGVVGSTGKVSGIVRICESVSDIDKVQLGEIIVASMTRPEYLPAMQKASAFITDEGGITCHAAIIAREMNKPCVIGTKNATKILKDGDLVEVDAEKGIVKKL